VDENKTTTTLVINLQEGFTDDMVVLRVNNKEVFRQEHITSNILIGLATVFTMQATSGEVHVDVIIPSKDLVDNYKFIIESKAYLGISIIEPKSSNRKIKFYLSREPFFYI
jgi:hypothetical protein